MKKKIPVVLDTDPGVDDAVCLALAVSSNDIIDLKAVTTIGGNNYTSVTTQNALDLLHLYGRDDIPVYAGEDSFLKEPFGEPVAKFHGANGLGNAIIPQCNKSKENMKASEAIYKYAKENPHELVIVTVGPETNLAKAFIDHPDLKDLIKKIVVMGGGIHRGNITPYAEANVGHDRFAADIVFSSGVPLDMIGLNVTLNCPLPLEIYDPLSVNMKKDVKEFIRKLIVFRNGEPMHDAIALATLIDDSFIEWRTADIQIEMERPERYGETVVTDNPFSNKRAASRIDKEHYYKVFKRITDYFTN